VQRFYDAVGVFYRAAAQYPVAKLPFNDKVLENVLVLLILRNAESMNSQWLSSFYNDSQII
jgi:hypothetical protein